MAAAHSPCSSRQVAGLSLPSSISFPIFLTCIWLGFSFLNSLSILNLSRSFKSCRNLDQHRIQVSRLAYLIAFFNPSTISMFMYSSSPILLYKYPTACQLIPIALYPSPLTSSLITHPHKHINMGKLFCTSTHFFSFSFILTIILLGPPPSAATHVYDVRSFGAKPGGISDATKALLNAWAAACASTASSAIIHVPKGRYLIHPVVFSGQHCANTHVTFHIKGTLVAPADYRILGKADNWLSFEGVSGVSISGGAFDAKGPALWACKAAGNQLCPSGATVLYPFLCVVAQNLCAPFDNSFSKSEAKYKKNIFRAIVFFFFLRAHFFLFYLRFLLIV